jgi:Lsr2
MAKNMVVTVTDDIDGSDGAETISFSYDGQSYEIDLGDKNRGKLEKVLSSFIDQGRRVSRQATTRTPRSRASRKDSGAIRAWAAEQGLAVSGRGRISAEVMAKYEAAH